MTHTETIVMTNPVKPYSLKVNSVRTRTVKPFSVKPYSIKANSVCTCPVKTHSVKLRSNQHILKLYFNVTKFVTK